MTLLITFVVFTSFVKVKKLTVFGRGCGWLLLKQYDLIGIRYL